MDFPLEEGSDLRMEKSNIGVFFSACRFQEAAKEGCVILNSSAEILLEAEDIVGVVFWFPSGELFYPNYEDTGIVFVVDVFSDEVRPKKVNEVSLFFVFFLEVGQIWLGPHR